MLTTYDHVWLGFLLDLRTAKRSQYGRLGGFGRSGGVQSASSIYPGQFMRDVVEGHQALVNYMGSAFFTWNRGAKLLFWIWSPETRRLAHNGHPIYLCGSLPTTKRRSQKLKASIYHLLLKKLSSFITKGYFRFPPPDKVCSYIDVFEVAKCTDIMPVFNGRSAGINDAVWAPKFQLPTATSMVNILDYDFEVVDCYLGEMFLNFTLDSDIQLFSGVDLKPYNFDLIKMHPKLQGIHLDVNTEEK